jgi:hypothetical protein
MVKYNYKTVRRNYCENKKIFSIILAVLMLGLIFSGLTVSAAGTDSESGTSGKVYFEKPNWAGTTFYCHIFETNSGTVAVKERKVG